MGVYVRREGEGYGARYGRGELYWGGREGGFVVFSEWESAFDSRFRERRVRISIDI